MMEVRFYNAEMNFIGLMENQRSLIWTRKFYEPGKMRLYAPLTDDNIRLTEKGNLVWKHGSQEAAVIEDRTVKDTPEEQQIEISGRFLSSYMSRRLIRPTVSFSGKTEVAMRKLLSDAEALPRVVLGDLNGFEETISFQATYKDLLQYETKLAKCSGIGFRFRPDFNEKRIYFETYKGKDRSLGQSVNNRVIFSERYDNLNSVESRENDQLLKTTVYVGGSGTGSERVIVTIGDEYTGLERRELFVDARDLTQDDGMTLSEYREKLRQRGLEKLAEYQESRAVSCVTDANANFIYKTHYDLGDIVTVKKINWGISVNLRITELEEVYESENGLVVHPIFGSPLQEEIDWRDD